VVDDDPDLVESVSMRLVNDGFRVTKAYDGVEAWDRIKEEKPQMLILDVMMPRKNGYVLCDEIKKDDQVQGHNGTAFNSGGGSGIIHTTIRIGMVLHPGR
jgi:two-component system alkaline phosphatase synthesis response regulator PhoP